MNTAFAVETDAALTVGVVSDARTPDPPDAVEKTMFAPDAFVTATFAVETDVVANNEGVVTVLPITFAAVPFVNTAFATLSVPVDTPVDASTVPDVRPVESANVVPLADVNVTLLTVALVMVTLDVVIVVAEIASAIREDVARNDPVTSKR